MVHTIALHCRLHNQAVGEALLPLVMKLGKGKELGKALKAKASGAGSGWEGSCQEGSVGRAWRGCCDATCNRLRGLAGQRAGWLAKA